MALTLVRMRVRLPVSESRMLLSRLRRAARSSDVLPSPNIRSKTTCGLSSIGSGEVGDAQEIVFVYVQL
jgi:hypothetical protein